MKLAILPWVYQERNLLHNGGSRKKSYIFHPTHPFFKKNVAIFETPYPFSKKKVVIFEPPYPKINKCILQHF